MTIEETGVIMDILKDAYPQHYSRQTDTDKLRAAKLWATMFVEDKARVVLEGVKEFIVTDTKGFPPSIGQVKTKIEGITALALPPASEELRQWREILTVAKMVGVDLSGLDVKVGA